MRSQRRMRAHSIARAKETRGIASQTNPRNQNAETGKIRKTGNRIMANKDKRKEKKTKPKLTKAEKKKRKQEKKGK